MPSWVGQHPTAICSHSELTKCMFFSPYIPQFIQLYTPYLLVFCKVSNEMPTQSEINCVYIAEKQRFIKPEYNARELSNAFFIMGIIFILCAINFRRCLRAIFVSHAGDMPCWLTHWGRVTHICISDLTIIGSDNGLSPGRRQAIIWTNAVILVIRPLETNFSEILIGIQTFSFKKIRLKMSSAKWRPFCLGLNVLRKHVVHSHRRHHRYTTIFDEFSDMPLGYFVFSDTYELTW